MLRSSMTLRIGGEAKNLSAYYFLVVIGYVQTHIADLEGHCYDGLYRNIPWGSGGKAG